MAAGWLQPGVGSIATGWGQPPELRAAPIGELVASALRDRLAREKMTQENVADAIKQIRQQRQEQAYLEAAQRAGVLPEGDISRLGPYGKTLADQIREKQEAESIAGYRTKLGERLSAGGGGYDQEEPETYTDDQERLWYKGKSGWHLAAGWSQPAGARPQSEHQLLSEENRLMQQQSDLFALSEAERQIHEKANQPNVPFSRADEFNRNKQRLQEIRRQREQGQQVQPQTGGGGQTTMPEQRFGSEADARAAGHQGGETVLVWDPDSNRYRPYILD